MRVHVIWKTPDSFIVFEEESPVWVLGMGGRSVQAMEQLSRRHPHRAETPPALSGPAR
jgi:hypothetical protein